MSIQEARVEHSDRLYDIEFEAIDPLGTTVDLSAFDRLSEAERRRIIIRVLCGLVAMEETPPPPAPVTELTRARPVAAPTPGPARQLPLLGIENGHRRHRARPRGWNTALLPHLGRERPY